jgi:hypothetical protein
MAITMNLLVSKTTLTWAGTSKSTGTFTPGTNTLVLCGIAETNSFTPGVTLPNGNGLTWVKMFDIEVYNFGSSSSAGLWRAMATSPSTGALTITSTASISAIGEIVEFAGVDTSGTNGSGAIVQSSQAFAASSPVNAALGSTSDAANAIFGFCGNAASGDGFSVGAGYTKIESGSDGALIAFCTEWITGVAQTAVGFSTTAPGSLRAFGVEIKVAAAPPPADTFTAAWSSQGTILIPGRPSMIASGSRPGPRVP